MKKTYIAPILMVNEAEMIDGLLTVTSIEVSDDSGNEQYVREQTAGDGNWTIDW